MKKILLSASLMCADFKNLEKVLIALEEGGIDFIHADIMDGHFVPNLTLSPLIIKSIKEIVHMPFDAHLMVEKPDMFIDELIEIGIEAITLHIETISQYAFRIIDKIKTKDRKVGIALNPGTSLDSLEYLFPFVDKITVMTVDPGFAGQKFIPYMLEKIKKLDMIRKKYGYEFLIEADGGIGKRVYPDLKKAGIDILVLGTSWLFDGSLDLVGNLKKIKKFIEDDNF